MEAERVKAALRRDGIDVDGQITRVWITGRGGTTLNVSYVFFVSGSIYNGQSHAPLDLRQQLERASTLSIRYSASNPSLNHPAGWESTAKSEFFPMSIGVILLLPGAVCFAVLRSSRLLAAFGLPAHAVATGWEHGGRGGIIVKYQFHLQNGQLGHGSYIADKPCEADERFCVIYLPDRPGRNQPYPLNNYRVAQ
jgi:hypothetical protein